MNKLALVVVGGVVAACNQEPSAPLHSSAPMGALLVTAELDDLSVSRIAYSVTATDLPSPVLGELVVSSGIAQAQLAVPAGEARALEVSYRNDAGEVCNARVSDVAIEVGRTAQVLLVPSCADARNGDRKANRAPKIEAIYATRRSVDVGELVAVAVFATDADNDSLAYKWTENVAGFGFEHSTRPLTMWKAGPRAMAHNKIRVTVQDGRGGTASRNLTMDFDGLALGPGTCAQPTRIKVGQQLKGFTRGLSQQGSDNCGIAGAAAPEHVFRLDLATRQDITISVAGSAFFARVFVRRGSCAATAPELCDSFTQRVDIPQADPGTYFIVVDGDNAFQQGEFQISVSSGPPSELCRNFVDDDGDGEFDCGDSDCAFEAGCSTCAFDCDPDPNDCVGGQCDTFIGRCNTFINVGTTCDADANPATADICNNEGRCVLNPAVCGNSVLELGEQCDDGNTTDGDGCSATCQAVAICGNGIAEPGEECDDGNTAAGDGCNATCQIELCGAVQCNDGNACTADVCTDASAGTCTSMPLDGVACELDGSPDTVDTCKQGVCVGPPTDDALIILDPQILSHPAFSLEAMHDRLAPNGDGAALFEQWATTLTATTMVNGRSVADRAGWATFLAGLPRNAAGKLDVAAAGFLPAAMVNRFDLKTAGNCGENRLVFTKTSGATNGSDRGTLIFEFNVPAVPTVADPTGCKAALAPWLALRTTPATMKQAAAVAILESFATVAKLKHFRTNEFVNAPFWELREFRVVGGQLVPFPVVDSVPFELGQDTAFRSFVIQNASTLNHGAREIGIISTPFLAAASRADGSTLSLGNIVPSLPGLEANLNILSCSGCHLTHTGTQFVHIAERAPNQPSQLSAFMRSELAFRTSVLDAFLQANPSN